MSDKALMYAIEPHITEIYDQMTEVSPQLIKAVKPSSREHHEETIS
jgi:hypothetical protein